MFIQTEETPNPNALKFLPGCEVMGAGTIEFRSKEAGKKSPLAIGLFEVEGISSVLFGSDYIAVSKTDNADWSILTPHIIEKITIHFSSNLPLLSGGVEEGVEQERIFNNPIEKQIQELIDTRVRPAVAQDGGDITFEKFEEGVVFLNMKGACSGCPSSTITLKNGIENMLKHYIPEVQEVRANTL